MPFRRLEFQNRKGNRLSARLDLPDDGAASTFALFAHCFTCGKDLKAAFNISKALCREGIGVLRFDFTGLGESEGDFADTSFSTNVEDLIDAADYLKQHFQAPVILIGHSLGGAAVLQAASEIPSARAVAVIAAPADPSHVTRHLGSSQETIREKGEGDIEIDGRTFRIRRRFLEDLEETRMRERIENLKRALIVFHSPIDRIVGIDNAGRIFQAAKHPKSFVSLDNADHLLSRAEDSRYVGAVIAAWARKYLELPEKAGAVDVPEDGRVVAKIGESGLETEILAAGHRLTADEPASAGGNDAGPTPYDLLAAALGACTAMTLRMYAERKQWGLRSAVIRLHHEKIHAEDCENCETREGYIDRIEREIALTGDLDADQRQRLMEIADKCPVHRTLHREVRIHSRLAPE
ncbi:MAG: alpha/beta fold hydrolase [Desulfobacterales bacterium]